METKSGAYELKAGEGQSQLESYEQWQDGGRGPVPLDSAPIESSSRTKWKWIAIRLPLLSRWKDWPRLILSSNMHKTD